MFYCNNLTDDQFETWIKLVQSMNTDRDIHFVHYSEKEGKYIRRIEVNGTEMIVVCGSTKKDLVFEIHIPANIHEGKVFDYARGKYDPVKLRYPITTSSVNKLLKLVDFAKSAKAENLKAIEEFKKDKTEWKQKREYLQDNFDITKSDREIFYIGNPFNPEGILREDGKVDIKVSGLPFEVACKILKILKGN